MIARKHARLDVGEAALAHQAFGRASHIADSAEPIAVSRR